MATISFGLVGVMIYLLMINVTLAHIEAVSGQIPFDMRPFGYGQLEAGKLLDGLGENGRGYYLTRQIPLDTAYPALLALTLISAICWLGLRLPNSQLVRIGIVLSIGAALFDYTENLGVAAMISSWPNPPNGLVYATSAATVLKSCLTVAAVSTTLLLGGIALRRHSSHPPD